MKDRPTSSASAEALRAKYKREREKRVRARPEGEEQFQELRGSLAHFDRDPFADPSFSRAPIVEQTDVVIIGGGFGGMTAAAHLTKQGVHDYRMLEKAADFGGTWYWNRYPGCQCDIESHVYFPMLEETGYMPKHRYAHASEIFAYCQQLGRRFDMYPKALFQTEVTSAVWDEERCRWSVKTSRNDELSARFLIIAGGILHKAKLPGIPGIRGFEGHVFHTSRWDYAYTGGGPEQPMDKLRDKRVAVIGTGATGIQVVPKLAEAAGHLYVFQRTPSAVGRRDQRETDPAWFAQITAKPGWQEERIRNFISNVCGEHPAVDLVQDAWTEVLATDVRPFSFSRAERERLQRIDDRNMEKFRERIAQLVKDPATAEALKPWYKQMCKRLCFHDEYLPTFNRDNVTLVDTEGLGVERITARGLVARGKEYPVDLMVFASGFELSTSYWRRLGFDPVGAGGVPMSQAWKHGAETLHGIHVRGFPNLLLNQFAQGATSVNFAYTISEASRHIAHNIARCLAEDVIRVEPTRVATYSWMRVILASAWRFMTYSQSCTPGSYNFEGQPPKDLRAALRLMPYMGNPDDWVGMLEAWRADGTMRGLKRTKQGARDGVRDLASVAPRGLET